MTVGRSASYRFNTDYFAGEKDAERLLQAFHAERGTRISEFPPMNDTLASLFATIQSRKQNPPPGSYTATLFEQGENEILKSWAKRPSR